MINANFRLARNPGAIRKLVNAGRQGRSDLRSPDGSGSVWEIGDIVELPERRSADGPRSYCRCSDCWWYRSRLRSLAPESRNVLSLVSPKETQVGSGFAVCRSGHAAMDAHILSDHGNGLLLVRAMACMDRNYQGILKLTHYHPTPPQLKGSFLRVARSARGIGSVRRSARWVLSEANWTLPPCGQVIKQNGESPLSSLPRALV
jgi:hypothetical protein